VAPSRPAPGSQEAALFAAIAAAPLADAPRLTYADWLVQHSLGWGEYIQVSCEAFQVDPSSRRGQALQKRLRGLERRHAKAFLAPIRPFLKSWRFSRGMLGTVVTDAQLFLEAADAIADRAPGSRLYLRNVSRQHLAALAHAPLDRFSAVCLIRVEAGGDVDQLLKVWNGIATIELQ
jgi:uncharacterized protein (TIGR02996 family)